VPSISVVKVGNGSVSSSDRRISCGSTCSAAYTNGDSVTLTATPAAGAVFTGWSGACAGKAASCTLAVADHMAVSAAFATAPTVTPTVPPPTTSASVKLSVGISNKGRIVGGGVDCPNGSCSVKLAAGARVTLTATPTVAPFVNWSGACTGSQPTCTLTLTADAQVQATFAK
jgi:hypothetical protein